MKLTFLGATREVTGSCYLLEVDNKSYLIDCGMEQGPDIYENQQLPVMAMNITAVFLTHAHIDHSGMLPFLYKNGFRGKVYMTRPSKELCKIMLMDSAHIQEYEAGWRKRKSKRGSTNDYEPIYTTQDVQGLIGHFKACDYDRDYDISSNVVINFIDAGHLLGSSSIKVVATENGITKTIVFSGDIGNENKPIIRNPQYFTSADYVVMESTYGDTINRIKVDYAKEFVEIIQNTFDKGGNVVVPSFAVGRMQELLYFMRHIKQNNLMQRHKDFEVYVDSPLAVEATHIFDKAYYEYYDEETKSLIDKGINPLSFDGLHMSVTVDESKFINKDIRPKVILSASGMCEAGRIRQHLKHNLWREESTIVFVGYQVEGTLGRIILDGVKTVKLFNEVIDINARIMSIQGTSSHADKQGLLLWASKFDNNTKRFFITHGEESVAEQFGDTLSSEQQRMATVPYNGCVWDLLNDQCIFMGNKQRTKPKTNNGEKLSNEYIMLLSKLNKLQNVVDNSKGMSNKNLRKLAQEIDHLTKVWG